MAIQIGNLLQKSLNKAGIAPQVNAAVACNEFDKIVKEILGSRLSQKAKAMYVKNGTLTVAVMGSAIGQEIKLNELEILEKIQHNLGEKVVTRLRYIT